MFLIVNQIHNIVVDDVLNRSPTSIKESKEDRLDSLHSFTHNPYNQSISKVELLAACFNKERSKNLIEKLHKNYGESQYKAELKKKNVDLENMEMPIEKIKNILSEAENKLIFPTDYKKKIIHEIKKESIPKDLRKKLWMHSSGARAKMLQNPDYFDKLVNLLDDYPDYFLNIIELDLRRTFPEKEYESTDQKIVKIRTILHSYAKRNPIVGYCQGLNFLVAKMLDIIDDEQEVFWLLATLIEDLLPIDFFTNMYGVLIYQRIFNDSIDILFPEVSKKLQDLGNIDSSIFTQSWFVCLFSITLSESLYQLVWDMLFLQGPIILVKVGLALIEIVHDKLIESTEFNMIFQIINTEVKNLTSQKELLEHMNKIYLNKELMTFVEEIYRRGIFQEKENELKRSKRMAMAQVLQKYKKEYVCKKSWPICVDSIEVYSREKRQDNIFIQRVADFPKLNSDYLTTTYLNGHYKNKKSKRLVIKGLPYNSQLSNGKYSHFSPQFLDDIFSLQNRLRVGRIDHTCHNRNNVSPKYRNSFSHIETSEKSSKPYKEEYFRKTIQENSPNKILNMIKPREKPKSRSPQDKNNDKNKPYHGVLILNTKTINNKFKKRDSLVLLNIKIRNMAKNNKQLSNSYTDQNSDDYEIITKDTTNDDSMKSSPKSQIISDVQNKIILKDDDLTSEKQSKSENT